MSLYKRARNMESGASLILFGHESGEGLGGHCKALKLPDDMAIGCLIGMHTSESICPA